jgi:transcription termination factor Rho
VHPQPTQQHHNESDPAADGSPAETAPPTRLNGSPAATEVHVAIAATPPSPQGGQGNGPPQSPAPPTITLTGILELPPNAEGRIRQLEDCIIEKPNDPWVPLDLLERFPLRQGQRLTVTVSERRSKRRRGRSKPRPVRPTVEEILSIEGIAPQEFANRKRFDELTPIDPEPRMTLEYPGCPPACRLIDLFCPIGYGTRGLIVSPPKAGKTILLQNIAFGIKKNHPDVELIALLIDERPEEVTDFKRNVPAQVLASSNDQDV